MILVANKADLALDGDGQEISREALQALAAASVSRTETEEGGDVTRNGMSGEQARLWQVSCKTKEGLDGFMEHLEAEVRSRFQGAGDDESPLITR